MSMKFEQIRKHQRGGFGSPCIFNSEGEASRALALSIELKPGMRAVQVFDGRIAIFRSASKLAGTYGYDLWHGGWEAGPEEMGEIGGRSLPVFTG